MASIANSRSNVIHLPAAVAVSAALDVPIFPCRPGKRPHTFNGFKDASFDPYQIIEWWNKWPDALIGMPTGEKSGYTVLDIDIKDSVDGSDSLHTLENQYSQLPNTKEVLTPSGGYHYWFKYADVRNSQSKIGNGLDIRGNGGYVIIPPSNGYEWEASNPDEVAAMPEWLIELANQKKKRTNNSATKQTQKNALIQLIKRKGDSYHPRLNPVSNLYGFPVGQYQAEFIGWAVLESKAFKLKKGQARIEMRFKVSIPSGFRFISGFHTVDVRQAPNYSGQMSTDRRRPLSKDLSRIMGTIDSHGFPIQVDIDDIDFEVFRNKQLLVSVGLTDKGKGYAIVTEIYLPP